MKVVVISAEPVGKDPSSLLGQEFAKGVVESGSEAIVCDGQTLECTACLDCGCCLPTGSCVIDDGFSTLAKAIDEADVVAFTSTLTRFGLSPSLETVFTRFRVLDKAGQSTASRGKKECLLLSATWNDAHSDCGVARWMQVTSELGWHDAWAMVAHGCGTVGAIKQSDYPEVAHLLGEYLPMTLKWKPRMKKNRSGKTDFSAA